MELEALLELLWAGDTAARDDLRRLGAKAAEAVPALGDAVAGGPRRLRLDALFVLEGMGPAARAAVPALVEALADDDPDIGARAADALGVVGEAAVDGLVRALDHDDWRVRQGACQALGVMGVAGVRSVPKLVRIAASDRDEVRERAVWALGEIGDERCLEPLATIFTREGGALGCWIAEAFGRFGRRGRPAADALRAELHRDDPWLALAAADALRRIGRYEDTCVWALLALLQGDDVEVRAEAATILGDFGPRAGGALPVLRVAEGAEDEDLRTQATIAILKIRPEAVAADRAGASSAETS